MVTPVPVPLAAQCAADNISHAINTNREASSKGETLGRSSAHGTKTGLENTFYREHILDLGSEQRAHIAQIALDPCTAQGFVYQQHAVATVATVDTVARCLLVALKSSALRHGSWSCSCHRGCR